MMKKMAVLLLALLLLAGFACAEESVTAYLPGDTQALTGFALEEAFSAQKKGYQTVGWRITAPDDETFMAFIDGYRDELIDQGFTLAQEVRPKGLNAVYYFFDHPAEGLTSARMNGIDFDLYLCGESGKGQMAMVLGVVPGINLSEPPVEESWESVFSEEEPAWESVLDDVPAAKVIPSFESFAGDAVFSSVSKDGVFTCTMEMKNLSAMRQYMMVLEQSYGLSDEKGGEEQILPLYLWLAEDEGKSEADTHSVILPSGEEITMQGYVFFALEEEDGQILMDVWYASGLTPSDTGDRWDGVAFAGAELQELQGMFAAAHEAGEQPAAEDDPAPDPDAKNVIPSFASFAKGAILSQTIENGRETFTLEMKNLSALLEYMMVLENQYGVSGQDGGETRFGLPMHLVLEDYEGELEPDRCTIMLASGEKEPVNGYVFFSLDEKDDLVKLAVWYAMGMTPANTGDRWNGMPLEGEYLEAMQQMFFEARTSGQTYPFRNDAVAKYVASQLDKDVSRITWTDVRDFNELIGVTVTDPDLSDVENMTLTNFSVVAKTEEAIDLSCLKNSEYLRILALAGGRYTGYETLAEKKWLERVLLSAESINDISWLENKELVRFVSIHDCSITDFSALATLPRLEQVYLEIKLSDDVSFLYGKGLDFGDTYTKPTCTFDEWYEHNWGKPGEEKKEEDKTAIQAGDIVIPSLEDTIGDVTLKSEEHGDLVTSYSYSFRYSTACYRLMDKMAEDMIATGFYQLAKCYDVSDMRFWEMTYVGGGELEPIGYTDEGEPYHVRLTCYAAWVPAMFDYISGVSIYMNSLITYGGEYQAPAPELFSSEGAMVTVRDFASYLGGTKLVKAERNQNGSAYYQYRYDYGDSVYSMISMYEGELKATGLFKTISVSRSGTAIFYYLAYIGPGTENISPAGTVAEGEYHVQLGCANMNYASSTLTGQTFVSIELAPEIAMAETTWAEGYTPGEGSQPEEIAGFTLMFRTVERPCLTCHGSGKCNLCNGTGVYRAYGEAVDCPVICSFCKGEKTYEAMEPYYVPN